MLLWCPACHARHVDKGEFATKPHHTHACQGCGMVWRPTLAATVGVAFLPEFKDPEPTGDERAKGAKTIIAISPDAPALLAQRLVSRLRRDRVIPHALENYEWDALTESLADEIHRAAVDGTLWRSA